MVACPFGKHFRRNSIVLSPADCALMTDCQRLRRHGSISMQKKVWSRPLNHREQVIQTTSAGSYFFSVKRYSCCASRKVRVRCPSLSSITKDKPVKPGTIVTNAVVPSSFLRDATADFHSPKSKRASAPTRTTAISPSEGFV